MPFTDASALQAFQQRDFFEPLAVGNSIGLADIIIHVGGRALPNLQAQRPTLATTRCKLRDRLPAFAVLQLGVELRGAAGIIASYLHRQSEGVALGLAHCPSSSRMSS